MIPLRYISFLCAFLYTCPVLAADSSALSAELDQYIQGQMQELHISGGVVLVVKDGETALLKGYGVANRETNQPVDAENTYFRIGSVTKTLAGTAVMKAVENGLLDLDADVNTYLNAFKIPPYAGEPVTLRQLLTHTANFDERLLKIGKRNYGELQPLGEYLAERMPPRVGPAGEVTNYSNHGITLAAHLVEAVTGQEFSGYAYEKILEPLGIPRGGFDQPFPTGLREHHAQSYLYKDGAFIPRLDWDMASQVWPSGAFAVTAPQMARFIALHLSSGKVGGTQILKPDTLREMHAIQHKLHPHLRRGRALAWSVRFYNGHKVLWHTGRVQRFTAQLVLIPDAKLGFFAAFNADEGDELRTGLFQIIAEHYLGPEEAAPLNALPAPEIALQKFSGLYRQTRHAKHGFEKLAMLRQEIIIDQVGNGNLLQRPWGTPQSGAQTWVCVAPGLFQAEGDAEGRRMAFHTDADGEVDYAFIELDEFTVNDAFERLEWYEGTTVHLYALGVSLALMLSMLLRSIGSLLFRLTKIERTNYGNIARIAWWTSLIGSVACITFVLGVAYTMTQTDLNEFAFGLTPLIRVLLAFPILGACCAGLGTICTLLLLGRRSTPFLSRWHLALNFAGMWLFVAVVHYWNLLGYHI